MLEGQYDLGIFDGGSQSSTPSILGGGLPRDCWLSSAFVVWLLGMECRKGLFDVDRRADETEDELEMVEASLGRPRAASNGFSAGSRGESSVKGLGRARRRVAGGGGEADVILARRKECWEISGRRSAFGSAAALQTDRTETDLVASQEPVAAKSDVRSKVRGSLRGGWESRTKGKRER